MNDVLLRQRSPVKLLKGYINRCNVIDKPNGSCIFCEINKGLLIMLTDLKYFFNNSLNISPNLDCCLVKHNGSCCLIKDLFPKSFLFNKMFL